MATDNPTGGDGTVALDLTDEQRRFLRGALADCRAGREDDLRTHPDHPNACRWRSNAAAYGRLIAGVDAGTIVPDAEVRRLIRELAEASDREEEYARVVFEHDALAALCEQIGAGR
ncbi:MAG TPA: hypothetical protein VGG40_03800 [Solirubrobacterales bacterium]|jgi:hypothetical protein